MLRTPISRHSPRSSRSINSFGMVLVLFGILHLMSLVKAAPVTALKAVTGTSDEVAQMTEMGVAGSRVTEGKFLKSDEIPILIDLKAFFFFFGLIDINILLKTKKNRFEKRRFCSDGSEL